MELLFGKHKGTALSDVPIAYLRWICRDVKIADLAEAARQTYSVRTGKAAPLSKKKPRTRQRGEVEVQHGNVRVFYAGPQKTARLRTIASSCADHPEWPGVSDRPDPFACPFDVDDALDSEYREIVGI